MAKYIIELNDDREIKGIGIRDMSFLSGKLIVNEESLSKLAPYEEPEPEKLKRWRANKNDGYFVVDTDGYIGKEVECGEACDDWYYLSGNYFRTEEEAEEYKESLIVYNELKAYAEPDDAVWNGIEDHWCVKYDHLAEKINVDNWKVCKFVNLYFKSKEAAQAAIEAVGEERVKRHYLGIKE